ncbi:30S ribosomal protein S3, partial [Candidatus Bathyarchaeota archaeon]|nr:30S ribosomal protein S3 [Candidatus Bathyarchaeota archaeon]
MSVVKHFIGESIKKVQINEFLQRELERAGYGGVDLTKTPLGTHIVVYAMRPGVVIGRGGEAIRDLAQVLEKNFGLPNPQISVAEMEVPELNAHVIASRIASALRRGIHYRRAGYWALNNVTGAGAMGVEIVISGKLRGRRSKYEKFRAGYLPKSGFPALENTRRAELNVQLKQGIFGVRVRIVPPDAKFPDKVTILEPESTEQSEEAKGAVEGGEPAVEEAKGAVEGGEPAVE